MAAETLVSGPRISGVRIEPRMLLAISIAVSFFLLAAVTAIGQAVIERTLRPAGRFVDADGGPLHIAELDHANTSEAPLVLLQGASGNLEDMRLVLGETLARRWRVLLFDRPGHGLSSRSGGADDASPARQAALIHDALGRLGVTRPILVAHSLGGAVATA